MQHKLMKILLLLFLPLTLFGLYVIGVLLYGTFTNYKPKEITPLSTQNQIENIPQKDTFTFLTWNVGAAGLGAEMDFFYEGGQMVRPKRTWVDKYLKGINETLENFKEEADFILLQEVDFDSKRSYFIHLYDNFAGILNEYSNTFALNFKVKYLPVPLLSTSPLGKVNSGLASFSKYKVSESVRYQFPGTFPWPKNLFLLKRCFLAQRIPLKNNKELIVINSHNSAYDDGSIRKEQMEYLRNFIVEEYSKGNYVVVGADWNMCPPNFDCQDMEIDANVPILQMSIDENFLPADWQWVFDDTYPTNRKMSTPYKKGETFTTLIDFYLVSPNISVLDVETINQDFKYSDHHPVKLKIQLK